MSRNLSDLHPDLLPLAEDFLKKCAEYGLDILVTCTYRTSKDQDVLYTYGRSIPNPNNPNNPWKTATNAKGGQSEHNFEICGKPAAKAFDIVPLKNKETVWDKKDQLWLKVAEIWRSMEPINGFWLDWYGSPGAKYVEFPHFCLKPLSTMNK